LRAYLGNLQRPVWGPPNDFLSLYAHVGVPGIIYSQTSDSRELDTAAYVTLDHLLVERRESVIFSVDVEFWYSLEYGDVHIEFFADPGTLFANRKLICPALEIEWGGEPTVMGPGVMN
jgi:hypothetical protein